MIERYYEGARSEMAHFLPKNYCKVLEIGCGKGGFRSNLHKKCEYWGVEPYEEAASVATGKLDKVLHGTFDDVFEELPDDYFDLVICNDVIEHMPEHYAFYEKIQKKCVNNAYMVGSLPNVRYICNLYELIVKKEWQYKEEGILDRTHLRFFTFKSILRDFEHFGFHVELFEGINAIRFSRKRPSGIAMMLFQKMCGKDTQFLQFGFRVKMNVQN